MNISRGIGLSVMVLFTYPAIVSAEDCGCEPNYRLESGDLLLLGSGGTQYYVINTPPPSVSAVTVTLQAVGDLDGTDEWSNAAPPKRA